jgi:hypothetical protein
MAVVYQHRRGDTNEVFYIGIGRDVSRAYKVDDRNRHWINTVDKVAYKVDILLEGISWEDACIVEKGMIADYGRKDLGTGQLVNMTDGGEGSLGIVFSQEELLRRSKFGKTRKQSPETRKKISESKKGKPGRTKSKEEVAKMLETKKRNGTSGHSLETRKKMSEARKGRPGRKKLKEEIEKLGKKVRVDDIQYSSMSEAERVLGKSSYLIKKQHKVDLV